MSHDILLRSTSTPPTVPDELFAGGARRPASSAADPVQSPAQKVHRLLRGRYGLAIGLALSCGVIGAIAGWFSQDRKMRSEALVKIDPIIRTLMDSDKVMPVFSTFIQSQPDMIRSWRVLQKAADSDEWTAKDVTRVIPYDERAQLLSEGIEALYVRGTQHIRVGFEHEDATVARAGVRAVVTAYESTFDALNGRELEKDLVALQTEINALNNTIRDANVEILKTTEKYGTSDLSVRHNVLMGELERLAADLATARFRLAETEKALGPEPAADVPELSIDDIARLDDTMRTFLANRREMDLRLQRLRLRFGDQHRDVRATQDELALLDQTIAGHAKAFRETYAPPVTDGNVELIPTPLTAYTLRRTVASLEQRYNEHQRKTNEMGNERYQVERLRNTIEQATADLAHLEARRDEKAAMASRSGQLSVIERGQRAKAESDGRKKVAVLGFAGGSMLPVALLLLIGLMDHRYRYSEETKADMSGMPLLGILPNLPDRLTDPEQAATAAHCVHQIRTMLQLSRGADPHVYAITSAAPGEGKTSLTLALGLSFAASGSRTLLIDTDLVGAGLTARLDMTGPEGVLEAMANRTIMDYVRTTDIADLSILPVGLAQAQHAGLFSPTSLRRMLAEARKQYEVVLIDTGPILGSIEATPVAAASDAVILCVSRGQQRPLVEKALQHLQQIGARFAGVVFNRAQARDFEQSISGMSLRSIVRHHRQTTNGNGAGSYPRAADSGSPKAFGPVARAVASTFRGESDSKS